MLDIIIESVSCENWHLVRQI